MKHKLVEGILVAILLLVVTGSIFGIAARCNAVQSVYTTDRETCLRCGYPEIACVGGFYHGWTCFCIGVRDGQSVAIPVESVECK